ncbi:response regulator [Desulfonatronum sp. SC1]|uniref:response regulator n=1 Tax=Desulfonatronum sp. SC1 TaxID=2109626 RepID=UPI000D2FC7C3|nr:response regulator [Desulfonatronum sp. SC1]PTN38426.1 response regulator [Desulfonatronum sp. SC1]
MKSLVVDDELVSRSKLKKIMEAFGPCDAVENGEEAVAAFINALDRGEPYTVILMDLMMPVMDGHEALRRIRDIEQERRIVPGEETRVIVVSCLEDQKNVCQAFFKGLASVYVTKPVNREVVDTALRSLTLE